MRFNYVAYELGSSTQHLYNVPSVSTKGTNQADLTCSCLKDISDVHIADDNKGNLVENKPSRENP